MTRIPCRERTFPLWLAFEFEYQYMFALRWLRHFLERLGRDHTLSIWQDAFQNYDSQLLDQILGAKWEKAPELASDEVELGLAKFTADLFSAPVERVSGEQALEIILAMPPFKQIRERFATLDVVSETTTYEALHLFRDGLALLAESVLDRCGKAGELVIYDALLEEWSPGKREPTPVAEFMAQRKDRFTSQPAEMDIFQAGLEVELVHASEHEVVTRVTECEWARYYRERHPRVGYMMACSVDNAAYRSFNDRIRLLRTSTLMEDGVECDFRVYGLPDSDLEAKH